MNNILEMIRNEKVEWKKLWEVTSWDKKFNGVEKNKQQKVDKYHYYLASELQALSSNDGNIKILTTNITDMYANEDDVSNNISIGEIVCIPWGGNPVVQYFNGKFITGDNRIARSIDTNILLNKYLYYFLLENIYLIEKLYRGSGIKHPNMKRVLEIEIPIPSLETQERIVKILDTMVDHFTQLEAELEAELEARNKQYEYYRDKLLSEEYLNKSTKRFGGNTECKHHILNEVSYYPKEKIEVNKLDIDNYVGVDNLLQNKLGKCQSNYLPKDGKVNIFKKGDVLVGNIRPYLKKIWFADVEGGANGDVLIFRIKDNLSENIIPEYLYHILADDKFFEYNVNYSKGAKMPRGDKKKLLEYTIVVPPLAVQKHIVSVLDNFDKIVTDINEGLPKEIELRQKQYEYYRERLLDFKRDDDE